MPVAPRALVPTATAQTEAAEAMAAAEKAVRLALGKQMPKTPISARPAEGTAGAKSAKSLPAMVLLAETGDAKSA
jgi:hypothetical protein